MADIPLADLAVAQVLEGLVAEGSVGKGYDEAEEDADKVAVEYVEREDTLKLEVKKSNSAYYSPATDTVVVPHLEQYDDVEEYYSTLFHELVHSTGVSKRCDRGLGHMAGKKSEEYSREELVAEIEEKGYDNL